MALTDMLGMGVTVQLRNMFSAPSQAIVSSSKNLTNAIINNQNQINNGWKLMGAGSSLMFLGTGLMAFLGGIGKVSLKSSNDLEILRNQIRLMARDATVGDNLFEQLTTFAVKTPFTIPQVMAGAKNLLAFGFTSQRVMKELQTAGEWASMMQMPIDYAAMILGKVRTGAYAQAMRFMQVRGISYQDIQEAGGPIDPKTHRTVKGADPEKFLAAVNKVIEAKFAGGMKMYMGTIPGMWSNVQDQLIILGAQIGDRIKPQIKQILQAVLDVFDPSVVIPFAKAVGDGLAWVLKGATALLAPIGRLAIWFMTLAQQHPGFTKLAIAVIALTGAVLNAAGATLILLGVWKFVQFVMGAQQVAALGQSLLALSGPVGWFLVAAGLIYVAVKNNFLGIGDVLKSFWDKTILVGTAMVQLVMSMKNGIGQLSGSTADALAKNGLTGIVTELFMIFYRAYKFVTGLVEGIQIAIEVMGYLTSAVLWVTAPLWGLVWAGMRLLETLGLLGTSMGSGVWKAFGVTMGALIFAVAAYRVGVIVATAAQIAWTAAIAVWRVATAAGAVAVGIANAVTIAFTAAARIATAVQWAWNAAMTANPIGLVIAAIAALVVGIIAFLRYRNEIVGWFTGLGTAAKTAITMLAPWFALPILIIQNWGLLKSWFGEFTSWISNTFQKAIDWIISKFEALGVAVRAALSIIPGIGAAMAGETMTLLTPQGTLPREHADALIGPQSANQNRQDSQHAITQQHVQQLATATRDMSRRPIQVNSTVKLDGRAVGNAVTTHQQGETASGR